MKPRCPDCCCVGTSYKGDVHQWRCRDCIDKRIGLDRHSTSDPLRGRVVHEMPPRSSPRTSGVHRSAQDSTRALPIENADGETSRSSFRGSSHPMRHNFPQAKRPEQAARAAQDHLLELLDR